MPTYLVTWNPERWQWSDAAEAAAKTRAGESPVFRWSTGNRTNVEAGDRIFLVRHSTNRGIIGSGFAARPSKKGPHWDSSRTDEANYVDVRWEAIVEPPDVLPVADLESATLGVDWRHLFASGVQVPDESVERLEQLWREHLTRIGWTVEGNVATDSVAQFGKLGTSPRFVKGRVYHRTTDIHGRFGGQKQGGIATPKSVNSIFLFTGEVGEQHGYKDGWTEDGVFVFYGEGQKGDMQFVRGNLAIRDHVADKKTLHLFQALGKQGRYRYVDEFTCGSTEFRDGPDTDGKMRRAIAFHLLPLEAITDTVAIDASQENLAILRKKAMEAASSAPAATVKETVSIVRERSAAVKRYVLRRANGFCESCQQPAPFVRSNGQPYLEPHHTTRLADDGPDDPRFVGAVCPNCHRAIHYGVDGEQKNRDLQQRIAEIENAQTD